VIFTKVRLLLHMPHFGNFLCSDNIEVTYKAVQEI